MYTNIPDTDAVSCSASILGSLLDFLKSDTGCRVQLPKLIDFSAQVIFTLTTTRCLFLSALSFFGVVKQT